MSDWQLALIDSLRHIEGYRQEIGFVLRKLSEIKLTAGVVVMEVERMAANEAIKKRGFRPF
ncbi:hypothetical protein HC231_13465 [Brenneria izadpanahii]|uniref:Uncharacterized protein n=1 Tax=Brenneria izadpanahii TaxID=2722756 RepID=A0ABX7UU26_9GAMM|nr:hypothetical protein [Brenneria izadpanahii]QTF08800.1 hypothetical protein HC231_13465 [Brenneria izadpanahii]